MIKIIAKGYKYLLTQIDDFLGSVRTIVISLKSVKGRKEYDSFLVENGTIKRQTLKSASYL